MSPFLSLAGQIQVQAADELSFFLFMRGYDLKTIGQNVRAVLESFSVASETA